MSLEQEIQRHYRRADLAAAILEALRAAGTDPDRLTIEDLAPVDEFHVRGRPATAELAHGLGLGPGMRVLDVGCGIGGPSRHVAATCGCQVVGIDLTEEFCTTAALLADKVGLGTQVAYRQGDALAMPFADASFDAAYTQHVAMNIADKAGLYAEIRRVLKPGAGFGIYDLLQGAGGEVLLPAPWARDPSISFLVRPAELRSLLQAAGFEILGWRETAAEARLWVAQMTARMAEPNPPPAALQLMLGADAGPIAQNVFRNLLEGRVVPTEVICRRP